MQLDWNELRQLQSEKLLYIVPHASGDYWILNYSPSAQYSKAWDAHPILLDCRGTIIDAAGTVIAKPFRKFFNVGERPETSIEALAALGEPEIAHKLDGSMVTLWRDKARGINFATRGSFTSPQAEMAAHIWRERHDFAGAHLHPNLTYIFELVGPDNRIVVHYPETALTLTGAVWTHDGKECAYAGVASEAARLRLPVAETEGGSWADLATLERGNFEGFVLFWYGRRGERRVKVKLAEYVRLHRIITGLSEHTIWEILSTGGDREVLRREIPEEMHEWFDAVTRELQGAHRRHAMMVEDAVHALSVRGLDAADRTRRKEIAAVITGEYADYRAELFRAVDGKEYQSLLWKRIEPSAAPKFADADA
jgi:RNA ligase